MNRRLLSPLAATVMLTSLLLFGLASTCMADDVTYIANPPHVRVSPKIVRPDNLPLCGTIGTMPFICYAPNFIRTAYNFPSDLDGTGQTILIVDAFGSPTIQTDLALFDLIFGVPDPPSFTIFCPEGCPPFNPNNKLHGVIGWSVETSLDVQYAHAMAPGANIVLVVAATSSGNAINTAEAAAIKKYPGSIMSQSFGSAEFLIKGNNAHIAQAHKNYLAAQEAGITVLASAGDFGAANAGMIGPKLITGTQANADFPASDPLVTAVGGTEGNPYPTGLATISGTCTQDPNSPDCTPTGYGGEQVWAESSVFGAGTTTGGAPSLFFSAPAYQTGLGLSARATPDVSYNAAINGGVLVVWTAIPSQAGIYIVGGTSAGSPQWAAIFALANQLAGKSLGFLNPSIYKLAQSSAYANDFHDITVGNNGEFGPGFNAHSGWDDATGWGTPNVANLVHDLVTCATTTTCP